MWNFPRVRCVAVIDGTGPWVNLPNQGVSVLCHGRVHAWPWAYRTWLHARRRCGSYDYGLTEPSRQSRGLRDGYAEIVWPSCKWKPLDLWKQPACYFVQGSEHAYCCGIHMLGYLSTRRLQRILYSSPRLPESASVNMKNGLGPRLGRGGGWTVTLTLAVTVQLSLWTNPGNRNTLYGQTCGLITLVILVFWWGNQTYLKLLSLSVAVNHELFKSSLSVTNINFRYS